MSTPALEQIRSLSQGLSPQETLQLIDDLVHQLKQTFPPSERKAFRSLWGSLADLGPAPSEEEIDEARREAWANFPREDIFEPS